MADPNDRFVPIPPNDPHYAAIGLIASNWARLERTADEAIWELLQAEPALSACVTGQMMGLRPRFNAIKGILKLHQRPSNDISRIDRLLQQSYDLSDQRNRVVHDPWFIHLTTSERHRYVATVGKANNPTLDFIPVSLGALELLAKQIHDFDQKTWETLDGILQPFRDTHPQWFSVARS